MEPEFMFTEEFTKLQEVKTKLAMAAKENAGIPEAMHYLRMAFDSMDHCYLAAKEAAMIISMRPQEIENAVEEAAEQGTIKFPPQAKA